MKAMKTKGPFPESGHKVPEQVCGRHHLIMALRGVF